jgi:hypothetical protein
LVVVAVDATDSIARRSMTSRTRSSIDTCVAAAPRRDRRPPPPPRSLGMHVTVASFRFRGSACRFMLDRSLYTLCNPLLLLWAHTVLALALVGPPLPSLMGFIYMEEKRHLVIPVPVSTVF